MIWILRAIDFPCSAKSISSHLATRIKRSLQELDTQLDEAAKKEKTDSDDRNMESEDRKVFNDPIHGNIELHPLCVKVIDMPEFQRLRFIKQLGGAYFVYPGASHNRFEHSIGTCHLAKRLIRALRSKSKEHEELITENDMLCVEIAALCHDLGHGPFSHLFDRHVIPKLQKDEAEKAGLERWIVWKHEIGSIHMLEYMLDKNNQELRNEFTSWGVDSDDIEFIKEMITGPHEESSAGNQAKTSNSKNQVRRKEKGFLYEIVSNKRNGIDVDKWDYFARDCYMLGIGNNFNHNRCIDFSRVIKVDGERQICFREKEAANLYDMFHTRYILHRRAYQHKTNNIIEIMLAEALVKANDFLKFPDRETGKTMLEAVNDMETYNLVTDHVIFRILGSSDENLKPSQELIKNVLSRNLYMYIGEQRFAHGTFNDKDDVKNDIIKVAGNWDDSIVIDLVKLNYGMQDKNPIDEVNFYNKTKPDTATPRSKDDVSLLLPKEFAEQLVRVYCKKSDGPVRSIFDAWKKGTERRERK